MALITTADRIAVKEGGTYVLGEVVGPNTIQPLPTGTEIRCETLKKGHCVFVTTDYLEVASHEIEDGEIEEGYTVGTMIRMNAKEVASFVFFGRESMYRAMVATRRKQKHELEREIAALCHAGNILNMEK